ncbi:hypothetical protein GDO81_027129 [Engystomops pustulosus]|uniref:Uncharacterized protein n=1 Tax=Engystomops pustulosus TaxID=76066 RepID=A0AAV6YPY7_ENGPU|nr:hypothetical protein GDO81_027129 [Engystomops pustulosus]
MEELSISIDLVVWSYRAGSYTIQRTRDNRRDRNQGRPPVITIGGHRGVVHLYRSGSLELQSRIIYKSGSMELQSRIAYRYKGPEIREETETRGDLQLSP